MKASLEEQSLITSHNAIDDVLREEECYTNGQPYVDYIERFYVGDYTAHIFENLRFYKRKKGKRAGTITAIYVNPKTGKGMRNPTEAYIKKIDEKLSQVYIPMRRSDLKVQEHLIADTAFKIRKNQRETIAKLRKEKQR